MLNISKIITFLFFIFSSATLGQSQSVHHHDPLDNMPIIERLPTGFAGTSPLEQREAEYRKFLAASVKIGVNNASGSGTIVYYDPEKKLAYVASCGHLWSRGVLSAEELSNKNLTANIIVWYHNDKKLDAPRTYSAKVIFYSYIDGQDTSLLTFSPDWNPNYFPVAQSNYEYKAGQHAHSLGCDRGGEVAHYDIEMLGIGGNDLVTQQNSPRPGRSGGGLMDDYGYYIGTCWGTQYVDGSGKGYFTPLSVIHKFWNQQNYGFLLNKKPNVEANKIPIFDRNGKQGKYNSDYVLLPMAG